MSALDFAWRAKPLAHLTRDELLDAARELAADVLRLEAENARLRRGYSAGAARPPYGKPKPVEQYEQERAL